MHVTFRLFSMLVSTLLLIGCVAPLGLPSTTQSQSNIGMNGKPLTAEEQLLASLPSQGAAPELFNETWLNSASLKLADLRGKVVMVEFWTFGCINCIHVTPSVKAWYDTYHDQGFEVIGVHAPEFAYEKELGNVKKASQELGITWPVAIDNDFATWNAYSNHYWPAMYLIDKAGNIRYYKIGEGGYEQTEAVIQALLSEKG
ncbi:MAG: redoxin domain-containing protein [Caldilineaceae bacterium]